MSNSQMALRQAFKAVRGAYAAAGRNPIITPSDLRLEVRILQNANAYQFSVLQSEGGAFTGGASNTEIRLNQNDTFWAVQAGLYVAKPSSDTDTGFNLFSYPNSVEFGANNSDDYKVFFNSSTLNIAINNVQYIQNFLTARFRNAPITQAGLGFGAASETPTLTSTVTDQFDGNESGITSLGSLIEISGQKKANIELKVPSGLANAPAAYDRLILVLRGFLALNAATR